MQFITVETGATITQIRSKEIFLESSTMEVIPPQKSNITIPVRRSEMAMLESTM